MGYGLRRSQEEEPPVSTKKSANETSAPAVHSIASNTSQNDYYDSGCHHQYIEQDAALRQTFSTIEEGTRAFICRLCAHIKAEKIDESM